jgi:hypothetical protein
LLVKPLYALFAVAWLYHEPSDVALFVATLVKVALLTCLVDVPQMELERRACPMRPVVRSVPNALIVGAYMARNASIIAVTNAGYFLHDPPALVL